MSQPTPENPFPINGAGVPGQPHPRRNVLELSTDTALSKQWNLYLQSMVVLQQYSVKDPNNPLNIQDINRPLGFYQIAGIHGAPFIPWVENSEPDDRPGPYCTHGTSLFLTWHRPYLLLLEQCLVDEAVRITEKFHPDVRDEYKEEALKIRLPYWDWATNSDIPGPLRNPKATISLPTAESTDPVTIEIDNPLYSYKFENEQRRTRDFGVLKEDILVAFDETKRCPDAWGYSHPEIVDRQLRGPINPIDRLPTDFRDGMYKLLTTVDDYGSFGNTGAGPVMPSPTPAVQSIESYHNGIHNYIGTDYSNLNPNTKDARTLGHMTEVAISAFDPIFWLHHANIDRIYAMWQSIWYESEFKGQGAEIARLPPPPTSTEDASDTTLRPFYHGPNQPWTSEDVQKSKPGVYPSVFDYNYHYPEIPFKAENEVRRKELEGIVRERARLLYGPQPEYLPLYEGEPPASDELQGLPVVYRREWMVSIRVKKYLVTGNFVIFFFLGKPGSEPHKWIASRNLVGSFSTFKSKSDYCANCLSQEESDAVMSGGIDLTNALYNRLQRDGSGISLEDDSKVVKWLSGNLEWRILTDNGKELNPSEVRGQPEKLQIEVGGFSMGYFREALGVPRDGRGAPALPDDFLNKIGRIYNPSRYLKGTVPEDMKLSE